MSVCVECRLVIHRRLQSQLGNLKCRRTPSASLSSKVAQRREQSTFTDTRRHDEKAILASGTRPEKRYSRPRTYNGTSKALPVEQILDSEISPDETRNLRRQLLWLKDPAKLAQRVRTVLAQDKLQQAINLVRLASTADHKPIVAWNAILGYLAGRRHYKPAFKIYNEMKKRAQYPDSYSVVHLLRGLALEPVSAEQVRLAVKLHDSLDASNSKVAKSIIHTNAALQVCVNANDHDTMWTMISNIPEQGSAAADQTTYTVILSALKKMAMEKALSDQQHGDVLAKALADGRKIWQDVLLRANKGQMMVDAHLVCGYSSLLLLDPSPDSALEVLSVVESTTGISREEPIQQKDGLDAGQPHSSARPTRFRRTRPNAQITSLVLKALYELRRYRRDRTQRSAFSYWTALTNTNDLEPDVENYHGLLRLLAAEGDSEHAFEAIKEMRSRSVADDPTDLVNRRLAKVGPQRTAYLLAFTACVKDTIAHRNRPITSTNKAPPSLQRANAIMDIMTASGKAVALKPVTKFLECAIASHSADQVHSALKKVMPILDKQLGREGGHEGFLQVPVDSIGDQENLLKLALETIRTLLSSEGRAALEVEGDQGKQRATELKAWQRQMDLWLQTHKLPRGKMHLPELKSLWSFSQALTSQKKDR